MAAFTFVLDGDVQPNQLVSFRGRERLNLGFKLLVSCAFPAGVAPRDVAQLVGRRAVLELSGHDEPRRIAGLVRGVSVDCADPLGQVRARLTFTSATDRLRDKRTRRVFRELSSVDVLARLLGSHGIKHRFDLVRTYAKRELCVQYQETDHDLFARLLAEEGLCAFWTDPASGFDAELVVTDHPGALPKLPGEPTLVAPRGQGGAQVGVVDEHHLRSVALHEKDGPDVVYLRHYDPMRPTTTLEATARWDRARAPAPGTSVATEPPARPHGEAGIVYEPHTEDEAIPLDRDKGRVLLEQHRRGARTLRAAANSVRLAPGRVFQLAHEDDGSLDAEYVITSVDHDHRIGDEAMVLYQASLRARHAAVLPRPPRPKRRPVEVTETAVIVGPPGQEIHVDEHGRVKVQFHWDVDGTRDDASSCWVRVALPWAGAAFGAMFVPRVGMEVLVSFIGGDPDRPVIVGAMHHRAHPPPFHLPRAKTISGVMTRSSPGGEGGHELSFEDAKGRELLRVASERDLELSSKNDQRIEVGADRTTNVVGDDTRVVLGNVVERVTGGASLEVQGASSSLSVGDVTSVVMGKRKEHYADLSTTHYEAGAKIASEGPLQLHVEGEYALTVGTGDTLAQTSVDGRLVLGASKSVTIHAMESVRLQVGTSVLELSPTGIKLSASKIELKAEEIVAEGSGPRLSLTEDAELVSEKIGIYSKKGGLEMEDDTLLWGQNLKLNPQRTGPTKETASEEQKTKPFKVQLSDPDIEPYAGRTYVLFAEGVRFEGKTDGDGKIEIDVPEATTQVDITLYLDEYPTGRRKTWSIRVAALPPPSTWPGALMRLHNLGYYDSGPKEIPTAIERDAVVWFQRDHDIEPSGELDGGTASELEKVHGS